MWVDAQLPIDEPARLAEIAAAFAAHGIRLLLLTRAAWGGLAIVPDFCARPVAVRRWVIRW